MEPLPVFSPVIRGRPLPRLGRNFLHPAFLEFPPPPSPDPLEFSSPLPDDLQRFLEQLRNG